MARGVNKVILVGNVGGDPETRYMPNGNAVTNITLATSESWKDKQTGQQQERTEWHRVVFFGRLAEIAGEYLRKGSQVYVEGSLRTRKWQGQDGQDRSLHHRDRGRHQRQHAVARRPPLRRRFAARPARAHAAPAAGPAAAVASGPAAATGAATGPGLRQLRRRHSVLATPLRRGPSAPRADLRRPPAALGPQGVFVFRRRRAARALRPGRLWRIELPAWH